jgi:hypothetical protein
MLFQITEIEFDFDDEDLTDAERDDIMGDTVGHIWEADDEDDLVEEITCATGWCIKSIDFRYVLQ